MVVDDAVVVRSLVSRWIERSAGPQARRRAAQRPRGGRQLEQANPDVVVLDVEMPRARRHLDAAAAAGKQRDLVVIMASALTRDNAEVTLKALALGAADYIPKPEAEGGVMTSAAFQRELIEKIRALGAAPPPAAAAAAYARRAHHAGDAHGSPARSSGSANGGPPAHAERVRASSCARSPPVHAARAADRRLDRRPAGADQAGRRSSTPSPTARRC